MQIYQLSIENFRVYSGNHKFLFDNKKLIIIRGLNGHGKSSFFDAIEWCLTGDIQRYVGSAERQKFNYIVHQSVNDPDSAINSSRNEAKVEIVFKKEGNEEVRIKRTYNAKKTISKPVEIDGKAYAIKQGNQKISEMLMNKFLLTDGKEGLKESLKSEFSTLFSSTQFLSQDQLQDFISAKKPQDRYLVLEKVLGVQKYGSEFQQYLKQVKEVVESRRDSSTSSFSVIDEQARLKKSVVDTKEELLGKIGEETEKTLHQKVENLLQQINELEQGLTKLQSTSITEELQFEIVGSRKELDARKDDCERMLRLLDEAESLFSSSVSDYEQRLNKINTDLNNLSIKLSENETGRQKFINKQNDFKLLKGYRTKYQETISIINNIQTQQEEYFKSRENVLKEPMIVEAIQLHEGLDKFKESYSAHLNKNKWLYEYLHVLELEKNITIKQQTADQFIQDINAKHTLLGKKKEAINNLSENIKHREQLLEGYKNNTIAQMIHTVQCHLLEQSDEHTPCPICGTDFQNPDTLHTAIKLQLEISNKQLNESEIALRDLHTELNVFKNDELLLINSVTDMSRQHTELLSRISKEETTISGDKAKISLEIKKMNEEQAKAEKRTVEEYLKKYEVAERLSNVLKELDDAIRPLEAEELLHKNTLKDLRNLANKNVKMLETTEISFNRRSRRIDLYLLLHKALTERLKASNDELKIQYSMLELQQNERASKLIEIQKYDSNFNVEQRQMFKQEVANRIERLKNWDKDLAEISSRIEAFLSHNQVMTMKSELAELTRDLGSQRKKVDYYNAILEQLKKLDIGHGNIQSELLDEYLQQYSERIDDLFMQISPHAFYRHVHLVPKKGELFVVVSDKKEAGLSKLSPEELEKKFNASLTFSSAQSNVLAVCIFLALSLSQEWTPLKTIGIDDPFQNLDDINVYSFLDVLSRILLDKQVIISTHDDKFANLIRYKSSLENHQIAEIWLESYSKDSIKIQSECHKESVF